AAVSGQSHQRHGEERTAMAVNPNPNSSPNSAPNSGAPFSSFGANASTPAPAPWPSLKSLPGELPPVMEFQESWLPDPLRRYAVDGARRLEIGLITITAAIWIAVAAAVGRRASIQPKVCDYEWRVTPNLWGLIIGRSGTMKSSTMRAAFRPLDEY